MAGDTEMVHDLDLTPMLNSVEQITRHLESLPGHPFGVQLDTGMNRLGMEEAEWEAVAPFVLEAGPELLMSHLACADEPDHALNEIQLANFHAMTDGTGLPRSLAATGGILLGPRYHFDLTRPGIGLYGSGGLDADNPKLSAAATIEAPILQVRDCEAGETFGYGATFTAPQKMRAATVALGWTRPGVAGARSASRSSSFAGSSTIRDRKSVV